MGPGTIGRSIGLRATTFLEKGEMEIARCSTGILSLLPISLSPSVRLWRQGHLDDILLAMSLAASCWSETMFTGTVSFCGGRAGEEMDRISISGSLHTTSSSGSPQTLGKKYFRNSCLPCTSWIERKKALCQVFLALHKTPTPTLPPR